MTRLLANLHDDRGFDVSWDVERGLRGPAEAFEHQYAWRMRDLALQFYTVGGDSPVFTGGSDPLIGTLRRLDHLHQALRDRDDIVVVTSTDDLDRVAAREVKGLVLTIEGAHRSAVAMTCRCSGPSPAWVCARSTSCGSPRTRSGMDSANRGKQG